MNEMQTQEFWGKKLDNSSIFAAAKSILAVTDLALKSGTKEREACERALILCYGGRVGAGLMDAQYGEHNSIYDRMFGVESYIGVHAPAYTSLVKYLKEMSRFAASLLEDFSEADGELISKERIAGILDYLNEKYDFCNLVFGRGAVVSIVNAQYRDLDGLCTIDYDIHGRVQQYITQFPLIGKEDGNTVEYTFFHELGHALHAKMTNGMKDNPAPLVRFIKRFFPAFEAQCLDGQAEIIADVFAMGLMFGSPFESQIHREFKDGIAPDDMMAFHRMTEAALSQMKVPDGKVLLFIRA